MLEILPSVKIVIRGEINEICRCNKVVKVCHNREDRGTIGVLMCESNNIEVPSNQLIVTHDRLQVMQFI